MQNSPKKTAVVKPFSLTNKLRKTKSESKSEIELPNNVGGRQSSQDDETSNRTSKSRSVEKRGNGVTLTSPRRSPKKIEIKCN